MALKLLDIVVKVVGNASKNPAVRRKVAEVASRAQKVFQGSKKEITRVCRNFVRVLKGKNSVGGVLKDAGKPVVKRFAIQYQKEGGLWQAMKDFGSLIEGKAKPLGNGKLMGKLPDGQGKVIFRPVSSKAPGRPNGWPTVEIQPATGRQVIKIRYE